MRNVRFNEPAEKVEEDEVVVRRVLGVAELASWAVQMKSLAPARLSPAVLKSLRHAQYVLE